MYVIPTSPSSPKHAPLCDYELTPIEYVRYHRNTESNREKTFYQFKQRMLQNVKLTGNQKKLAEDILINRPDDYIKCSTIIYCNLPLNYTFQR